MDPSQTDDERKLRIFFELHARSHRQARSGNRSPNCSSSCCYNIDGSWQGNSRWFFFYFLFIQGLLISFCEYVLAQTRIGATSVAVSVWDIEKMWPLFTLSLKGKHCTTPNLREWFPLSNKCPSILLSNTCDPPYWILARKKIIAKYILLRYLETKRQL